VRYGVQCQLSADIAMMFIGSDIFVNENENENYCAFVHENENENFLKNENRIRTKINLSERIEINY
jgi:shikimate kinase